MVDFTLNKEGVKELLNSEEMQLVLRKEADKVLRRLNKGYGASPGFTSQRAKISVGTQSHEAIIENLEQNTLLKALGGASD